MPEPTSTEFPTFLWKGQLRYKCPRKWAGGSPCAFDTYSLEMIRKHVAEPHTYTAEKAEVKGLNLPDPLVEPAVEFKEVKFADEDRS